MSRLELLVTEIKATLDTTLSHLATKAELSDMRAEMRVEGANMQAGWKGELAQLRTEVADMRADLKTGLADKPSKTYMWGVLTALLTAYACGLAALAILK